MIYWQDIRYACRLLARSPGFTLLTVLVLAGGLGVSTFTFSFLYTGMIRPLPLDDGERIVRLMRVEDGRRRAIDAADLSALAAMQTAGHLGGYEQRDVLVGREGKRRVLTVTVGDPTLFAVAGTPPLLGRTLQPADAAAGAAPVVVLAFRTWQAVFGADRAVLDTDLIVNGLPTRVVGVMPHGFGFPVTQDAWLPLPARSDASLPADREFLSVFARLAPGATHADAAAEARTILQRHETTRATPGQPLPRSTIRIESFPAAQIGDERLLVFTSLNLLALLILLLSVVNVTTLLTARANERIRETAVRLALGASTGRLVVQSMWEGVILCVAAGILGTAGAAWGLDAVTSWTRAHLDGNLAFWWVWRADRITLVASGLLVTLAIAVLGSVVSRRATSTNVREVLQDGGVRSGSRREGRLARRLVATQVATVTVLMFVGVVSGVLAHRVVTFDPGYDPSRLQQVVLAPSADRFTTDEARDAAFRTALAQLDEHAAIDDVLVRRALGARGENGTFAVRGQEGAAALPTATIVAVLGNLSTVGVDVVAGRAIQPGDDRRRELIAVISRSLAARLWPGSSPLGRQLRAAGLGDTEGWRTIVGVVSDVPHGNPFSRDRSPDAIYVPLLQSAQTEADVLVRHQGSDVAGRQALVDVFAAIDPQSVPQYVHSTEEVLRKSALITTATTKLVGACFAFALLLAVVGTYGLMSRSIGLRTREIAVRRALGATDGAATRMLLEQGARQLGVGTLAAAPILAALGTAAVYALPVSATLTATAGIVVSAAILAVVLTATWLPARKTLRVPLREALGRE